MTRKGQPGGTSCNLQVSRITPFNSSKHPLSRMCFLGTKPARRNLRAKLDMLVSSPRQSKTSLVQEGRHWSWRGPLLWCNCGQLGIEHETFLFDRCGLCPSAHTPECRHLVPFYWKLSRDLSRTAWAAALALAWLIRFQLGFDWDVLAAVQTYWGSVCWRLSRTVKANPRNDGFW